MVKATRVELPRTSGWSIQQFPGAFGVGAWTILANEAGDALHWFGYAEDAAIAREVLRDARTQLGA